jgi:peptidoglycan-associated lipoprotein
MILREPPQRILLIAFLGFLVFLTGCPKKPPTRSYEDALESIKRARSANADDCAKEELKSAEKMMAEAQKFMDEGKYDEAKVAFDAAKKLADKAAEEAKLNREECLKKKKKPENTTASNNNNAQPPTVITSDETPVDDKRESLQVLYFGFNQYKIEGDAKDVAQKNADWLKKHKNTRVQIEGHCDQRGSIEYNLALGERRAIAVKTYLEKLGVEANRITIISYGHQRPADPNLNEEAYTKNRRAEFKVSR